MIRQGSDPISQAQHNPVDAVWPVLAALAGLAFCRVAYFPPLWAFLCVIALLIPLLAILSGSWNRFFLAFMVFGISLNLDKTFNHAGNLGGVGGLAVSVVDIALVCLLVPAIIKAATTRTFQWHAFWPTTIPALILMQIMALSIAVSSNASLSFFQLLETGKLFVLYLFIANHVQSEDDLQFVIRFLLAGILFQGGIVILQYLSLFPEDLQSSLGFKGALISSSGSRVIEIFRPSGTIGHANVLGAFLATSLPVAISQMFRTSSIRGKLFPLLALGAGATALVMTFSRGAWISFSVAAVFVLTVAIKTGRLRGRNLLVVAASIVAVAILVVNFSNLVESRIFDPDPGSAEDRMRLNRLAWGVIQDNPLLGVGLNTFGNVMAEYDTYHFVPGNVVHNVYLLLTAECGIFALLAFLWFILAVEWQAMKVMRSPNPNLSITATAMLGGIVGMTFQMLLEILITGPPVQVFWYFAGLLAAMSRLPPRRPEVLYNHTVAHKDIKIGV